MAIAERRGRAVRAPPAPPAPPATRAENEPPSLPLPGCVTDGRLCIVVNGRLCIKDARADNGDAFAAETFGLLTGFWNVGNAVISSNLEEQQNPETSS